MKCLLLLFFCTVLTSYSQTDLHHQALSSQGNSIKLYNGVFISQTIGQQSVIGNATKNGYTTGQGYQQSIWSKYINSNLITEINTTTYPNPFIQSVNFQFSSPINDVISVAVFDIRGRLIYQENKKANDNILTIELGQLSASNYLVRLSALKYTYYTQILKKQ